MKQKAYLLYLGVEHCHDADEWKGIFTDMKELKCAYDELLAGKGTAYESYLNPYICEFPINQMDAGKYLKRLP